MRKIAKELHATKMFFKLIFRDRQIIRPPIKSKALRINFFHLAQLASTKQRHDKRAHRVLLYFYLLIILVTSSSSSSLIKSPLCDWDFFATITRQLSSQAESSWLFVVVLLDQIGAWTRFFWKQYYDVDHDDQNHTQSWITKENFILAADAPDTINSFYFFLFSVNGNMTKAAGQNRHGNISQPAPQAAEQTHNTDNFTFSIDFFQIL